MGVSDVLEPTMVITNVFIDSDGTVVSTLVLKIEPLHVQTQRALAAARFSPENRNILPQEGVSKVGLNGCFAVSPLNC